MILIATLIVFSAVFIDVFCFREYGSALMGIKLVTTPVIRLGDNVEVYRNVFDRNELLEKERLMVYSDEMISDLCRRFDMYNYYKIDPRSDFAFEALSRAIGDRLSVSEKTMDVIVIGYKDADARFAANVLDEVAVKLEEMNRSGVNELIKANQEVYNLSAEKIAQQLKVQESLLTNALSRYDSFSAPRRQYNRDAFDAQLAVYNSTAQVNSLKSQLTTAYSNFTLAENTIEKSYQPLVRVVTKPMPVYDNRILAACACGAGAAILAIALFVIGLYYLSVYKLELTTLFGAKSPQ